MESGAAANIVRLRATFENREAICIEKGAIRVRIFNIHGAEAEHCVHAEVEEILTPGLGVGMFDSGEMLPREPRRWRVTAGHLTSFNEHEWTMGYGGWTFYIGSQLVSSVCEMAARFPENLHTHNRYNEIVVYIQALPEVIETKLLSVFPDANEYQQSQRRSRRRTQLGGSHPLDDRAPACAPASSRIRVGLVRHFPVTEPWPSGWVTSDELQQWRVRYEAAEPIIGPVDVSEIAWQRCFSSDLKRAYVTAQAAFPGTIVQKPLLREAEVPAMSTGRLRLPVWGWRLLLRLLWFTGHKSQRTARDAFRRRILTMAEELGQESGDILIVSHAGVMFLLRKELLRRGFHGPKCGLAEYGRLYVFERP